jgi:hypothetical protein
MKSDNEFYIEQKEQAAMQTDEPVENKAFEWQKPAVTRESLEENSQSSWLNPEDIDDLQSRWNSIQIAFVDDPHISVKQAAGLVAEAKKQFEQTISDQISLLADQWTDKTDLSTARLS